MIIKIIRVAQVESQFVNINRKKAGTFFGDHP